MAGAETRVEMRRLTHPPRHTYPTHRLCRMNYPREGGWGLPFLPPLSYAFLGQYFYFWHKDIIWLGGSSVSF